MSDYLAGALDAVERVQREAIETAHAQVECALDTLKPFEMNDSRILPGVARAVADERKRLTESLSNLAGIISVHFSAKEAAPTPPTPIAEGVDERHLVAVRAAKAGESEAA